jgi:hypothetical protein
MKKYARWLGAGVIGLAVGLVYSGGADALLKRFPAGFRLVDGTQLNTMVDALNGVPNVGGTGTIVSAQWIGLNATYTLTSTTAAQKLFNTPTNGTFTTAANTTYEYFCNFTVSSMSATSGNAGFDILGAGTATVGSATFNSLGVDQSTLATPAAQSGQFSASTGLATDIVVAATGTAMQASTWGLVRVTTAGTLIPSIKLTTAAAAVVGTNSYCRLWSLGNATATSSGPWN